ncbi:MAG: sigma-70 family RNA polymerase sigma factor [Spirochaetia bacterium]
MDTHEQDLEDRRVISSVIEGNRNAFRAIFVRYRPVISNVGRRLISSSAEVPDYVQDVFLKAYSQLKQYSGRGRFYSWLMRIAYTTAINRRNRRPPEMTTDPEVMERCSSASASETPERRGERTAVIEALGEAVAGLPAHLRRVIQFSYFSRLRYADISRITGIPKNTVKSHVFRARRILRDRLYGTIAADCIDV